MNISLKYCILLIAIIVSYSVTSQDILKIEIGNFSNLYRVNDSIYRSEQPESEQMKVLEEFGIKTILNLREYHTDNKEAQFTILKLEHIRINTWKISESDIVKVLKIMKTAKKPLLIHCLHGSDRTGCVIAAYRMVYENWSRQKAIDEFKLEQFGYHEKWFPNILELLSSLNVEHIRNELSLY